MSKNIPSVLNLTNDSGLINESTTIILLERSKNVKNKTQSYNGKIFFKGNYSYRSRKTEKWM